MLTLLIIQILFKSTEADVYTINEPFGIEIEHVQKGLVRIVIEPGHAYFTEEKELLVFSAVMDDGELHTYKLLPIDKKIDPTEFITDFLIYLGVESVYGQIKQKFPSGRNAIVGSTFIATRQLIKPVIKSFAREWFNHDKFGYYDVATNKIVFKARYGGKWPL